jgi:hypothetical protein
MSLQNFGDDFTLGSMDNLRVENGKFVLQGMIKNTPIDFYYDMENGDISINNVIAKNDTTKAYHINDPHATTPLAGPFKFTDIVKI